MKVVIGKFIYFNKMYFGGTIYEREKKNKENGIGFTSDY